MDPSLFGLGDANRNLSKVRFLGLVVAMSVENLNQVRSDRRTVELRFSWEGVLNHT